MTRKRKGPAQRTPAQVGGSTEQDRAGLIRDECIEQLRRIAEDAENAKIRLLQAPSYEDALADQATMLLYQDALRAWPMFPTWKSKWMRRATESVTGYVEEIGAIFLDADSLIQETGKNWPLFKVHLDGFLATLREIFEQSAIAAISQPDETKRWDSLDAEREVQRKIAMYESQIVQAKDFALRSTSIWIGQELERRKQSSLNSRQTEQREGLIRTKPRVSLSSYMEAADLTTRQREVFSLKWEHGMSVTAIARRLGLDESTVREHLRRAEAKVNRLKNRVV